jgi:hypothetical protein
LLHDAIGAADDLATLDDYVDVFYRFAVKDRLEAATYTVDGRRFASIQRNAWKRRDDAGDDYETAVGAPDRCTVKTSSPFEALL